MTTGRLDEMQPAPDTPRFRRELGTYLHARTRRARRGRRWLAVPGVAVAIAVALVLAGPVTGDRPRSVALAAARTTLVLDDGTSISIGAFFDPASLDRLRKVLEGVGATLEITEVPVVAAAEGRVLGFSYVTSTEVTLGPDLEEITFGPGDRVEVTVGRPARNGEQVTTEGLTLEEVFPEVGKAVQDDDPVATGEALEQLGFTVRWKLVSFGPDGSLSHGKGVATPPPGTYVVTVSQPGASPRRPMVDPGNDELIVQITHDREAIERLRHPGGGSGG